MTIGEVLYLATIVLMADVLSMTFSGRVVSRVLQSYEPRGERSSNKPQLPTAEVTHASHAST